MNVLNNILPKIGKESRGEISTFQTSRKASLGRVIRLRALLKEAGDEKPEESTGVEFGGVYRVSANDKGGFDVHNFALSPSIKIDGDTTSLSGSMISFSCYSQTDKSVCELNVRDFELGDYKPFQGFTLGAPIGDDYTEVFTSK